ncbi:unnamed protein product, partial [Musa acuminata var. zebrina]
STSYRVGCSSGHPACVVLLGPWLYAIPRSHQRGQPGEDLLLLIAFAGASHEKQFSCLLL